MKIANIGKAMSYLDDDLIFAAAAEEKKRGGWVKWCAAACLCLALLGAATVGGRLTERLQDNNGSVQPDGQSIVLPDGSAAAFVRLENAASGETVLLRCASEGGEYRLLEAANETVHLPADAGTMTREEAEEYAYQDYDTASPEMQTRILEARNAIIYSEAWVADGYSACIMDTETGEVVRTLPAFSELFPGWALPVTDSGDVTKDGLGADCLYGLELRILQVDGRELRCSVSEGMNGFTTGQTVTVLLPEGNTDEFYEGDRLFLSYLGENCDMTGGTIQAESIDRR